MQAFSLEDATTTNPAEELVADCIKANVPVVLIGAPGTGKTAMLKSVSRKLACRLWVLLGSTMEPSEVTGQPVVDKNRVLKAGGREYPAITQVPPDWAVEAAEHGGIVFWDELNTASPSTMAAMLTVILDKTAAGLHMPHVAMVAAMNPVEMSAGGSELPPAMANRFYHLPFEVQPTRWANHFRDNFARANGGNTQVQDFELKPVDAAQHAIWRENISKYIERNPQALLQYPADPSKATGPWPSPRTWDMFSRLMAVCDESNRVAHGNNIIGNDATAGFFGWYATQANSVDPEKALADPLGFDIPKRSDSRIAMADSIAQAILDGMALTTYNERLIAAWSIVNRLAENSMSDTGSLLARKLYAIHRQFGGTKRLISIPLATVQKLGDPTLLIEMMGGK